MNKLFRSLFAVMSMSSSLIFAAEPISERDAVQRLVEHNPTLQAAVTDVQRTAELVRAENARYRPSLLLDATGTTQKTPSLNSSGGTTGSQTQSLVFGAEMNHTFTWGTTVDLRLESRNSTTQGPAFTGTSDVIQLGPGYNLSATLSVTQPLLRGFGNEVGLAGLRSAVLNQKEAERFRYATASDTISAMLQSYWELWYAEKALGIQREARTLALQQLDETQRKVKAGSAAEVEQLTHETRVAELDQAVLAAEITVRQREVELKKQIGASTEFEVSASVPTATHSVDATAAITAAQEASYSVLQQRIAVEMAQNTLRSAADATRPRLDVKAWVQTQGLGNQSVTPALTQLGSFANVSGNVGVVFEMPLSSARHDAEVASSRIALTVASERLEAAKQQVAADTSTELATLDQARQNIALAERSADVANRTAEAQRKRFLTGSALEVEVRQAEDSLRTARLSIERERVNAVKAHVRLAHLTGELLAKWGTDGVWFVR